MEILKYIFFLGIIYIVFSIIWFFIALLPKYILGNKENNTQNIILNYIIKAAQFYFLASLTAIKALDFITKEKGAGQVALLIANMEALSKYAVTRGAGFFEMAKGKSSSAFMITISVSLISALLIIAVALYLILSMLHPVNKLRDTIDHI